MILSTTLEKLRMHGACYSGYNKLVRHLQGKELTENDLCKDSYIRFAHKEPIDLLTILESNGLDDCIWSLRAATELERAKIARLFAADCAESVLSMFESQKPDDQRPRKAIQAARDYAVGLITDVKLIAARAAARDAAEAAARDDAAWAAAGAAAWDAAGAAAWDAARDAAWAAARAAARDAARDAQAKNLAKYLRGEK